MNKKTIFKVAIVISTMALSSCNLLPNLSIPNQNKPSSVQESIASNRSSQTILPSSEVAQPGISVAPQQSSSNPISSSVGQHTHQYGDWYMIVEPTCTAKGAEERQCSICGITQTRDVMPYGHDLSEETIVDFPPSCTTAGVCHRVCRRCNYSVQEEIPPLGHDWGEWVIEREAGCQGEGLKRRTCQREGCGAEESDIIAKTSHNWGEWYVTKPATCVAGEEQRECSICQKTETRAIAPVGTHAWGEWQTTKAPSCAKGQEKRTCQNCGLEEYRETSPLLGAEHCWGEPIIIEDELDNQGNIVKAGYTMKTCDNCGGVRLELETAKATLDPILTKDGEVLYKNGQQVMSRFKVEETTNADDDSQKIRVGVKLDKYSGYSESDNPAFHGSFSFKFGFDRAADVTIYQRGSMDSYSHNRDRTYYSGADDVNYSYANFEFDVNGNPIDLYGQRNVKYRDVVTDRNQYDTSDPLRNSGYSTFGDFLIGESQLVAGENTFTYKRLASYTLITTHIILEITYPDHAHEAAPEGEWINTDSDFHWKNCMYGDGHKIEKARHVFTETIEREALCTESGLLYKVCSICHYAEYETIPALGHSFTAWEVIEDPQLGVPGVEKSYCVICHVERYQEIPALRSNINIYNAALAKDELTDQIILTLDGEYEYCDPNDFNWAFGLLSENYGFFVGSDSPNDEDFKYAPSYIDPIDSNSGTFTISFVINEFEVPEEVGGVCYIYAGPKECYGRMGGSIGAETFTDNTFRYYLRNDGGIGNVLAICFDRRPPFEFADAEISFVDNDEDGYDAWVAIYGQALDQSKTVEELQAEMDAITPYLSFHNTRMATYRYEPGVEPNSSSDIIYNFQVYDVDGVKYIRLNIRINFMIEQDSTIYNTHLNVREYIQQDCIMDADFSHVYDIPGQERTIEVFSHPDGANDSSNSYGNLGFRVTDK